MSDSSVTDNPRDRFDTVGTVVFRNEQPNDQDSGGHDYTAGHCLDIQLPLGSRRRHPERRLRAREVS